MIERLIKSVGFVILMIMLAGMQSCAKTTTTPIATTAGGVQVFYSAPANREYTPNWTL